MDGCPKVLGSLEPWHERDMDSRAAPNDYSIRSDDPRVP